MSTSPRLNVREESIGYRLAKHDHEVDANQEMVALGAANAASGLFGAFTVDGSLSRTAAADQAAQKTQFASIALSAAIFITILFLTGLFENLAEATLAAIIIHAVWHLIDLEKITRYVKIRKDDFYAGLVALLGVLFFDILTGLLIAVGLSLLLLLARASRPRWTTLGRRHITEADDTAYQSVDSYADAETIPGLVIIRFEADLFFANASAFADDVRSAIDVAEPSPSVVLVDAESISDVDSTAIGVVRELRKELAADGIELWAARVESHVSEMLTRYSGQPAEHIYPTVRVAVQAFESRQDETDKR
ncbi:MAG: SulP family inorganic anion transporter [Chloroflexota bacterium]